MRIFVSGDVADLILSAILFPSPEFGYNSSNPYHWTILSAWHRCYPVGWQANFIPRPLNANIAIKTLVGLHDVLRRSKLFDGSVFQPDNFVADCLYDLHVM